MINPGRFWGYWGSQPLGPALDGVLTSLASRFKISKEDAYGELKKVIFAIRLHALSCAIYVSKHPKPEYSIDQSLKELFTMWSNQYWETFGPKYPWEEYYKNLEAVVKEELKFDIHEMINGYLTARQFGKIPADFGEKFLQSDLGQFLEFIYIVRTDAVNKLLNAINEKSATHTTDSIVQELVRSWNPGVESQSVANESQTAQKHAEELSKREDDEAKQLYDEIKKGTSSVQKGGIRIRRPAAKESKKKIFKRINPNTAAESEIAQLVGTDLALRIMKESDRRPFTSLDDLQTRCTLTKQQVEELRPYLMF